MAYSIPEVYSCLEMVLNNMAGYIEADDTELAAIHDQLDELSKRVAQCNSQEEANEMIYDVFSEGLGDEEETRQSIASGVDSFWLAYEDAITGE